MANSTGSPWRRFPESNRDTRSTVVALIVTMTLVPSATAWSANDGSVSTDGRVASDRRTRSSVTSGAQLHPFVLDLTNLAALTQAFSVESGRMSLAEQHVEYGAAVLELDQLEQDAQQAQDRVKTLNDEFTRQTAELLNLKSQQQAVEQRITELRSHEKTVQADIEVKATRIQALQQQHEQLSAEIAALERKKHFVSSSEIREKWNTLTRAQQAEYLIKYLQGEDDPESYFPPDGE